MTPRNAESLPLSPKVSNRKIKRAHLGILLFREFQWAFASSAMVSAEKHGTLACQLSIRGQKVVVEFQRVFVKIHHLHKASPNAPAYFVPVIRRITERHG